MRKSSGNVIALPSAAPAQLSTLRPTPFPGELERWCKSLAAQMSRQDLCGFFGVSSRQLGRYLNMPGFPLPQVQGQKKFWTAGAVIEWCQDFEHHEDDPPGRELQPEVVRLVAEAEAGIRQAQQALERLKLQLQER